MADAAESIMGLGVDMFNVHASAGVRAMKEVMSRLDKYDSRPIVLAVTALTSFTGEEFSAIYGKNIGDKANQFARDAQESGLDGVVCSAHESASIKNITNRKFMTLTPGIRPFGEDAGDQKRVADIAFAQEAFVDFIVVGRPIYQSKNPAHIVKKILENL